MRPTQDCHGNVTPVLTTNRRVHGNVTPIRALVVEDIRAAEIELRQRGHQCDRLTHNELLSSSGTEYTGKLLRGEYSMLWISTPNDWHARIPTKKATAHWQRILHWIQKAINLRIIL